MYRGPTRYIWYLASNTTTRADQYLPTVVKLDTRTNTTISWSRAGGAPVSPMFVPADRGQPADSDAGSQSQTALVLSFCCTTDLLLHTTLRRHCQW